VELHGANTPASVAESPEWNTIKWQTVKIITSDFIDESGYSEEGLQILTTGLYRIDLELCFEFADTTQVATRISKTTGDWYEREEIPYSGSCVVGYEEDILQVNSSITVYLTKGEHVYFEFRTTNDDIELYSEIDEQDVYRNFSRARISFIPMGGWNNNNCGNIVNRGVRR
jgi:hypothetical protein